jgi:protein-tyrosine-phosphatase
MQAAPDAAHKIFPLADAEPVEDPIGQSPAVYRKTADQLERLIRARLATIAP